MGNVFTYGSLMFDPVWSRVVEGSYRHSTGIISGFIRKIIRHETYPAVYPVAEKGHIVAGIVYFGVVARDIARLDAFEGDYYRREEIHCRLPDGTGSTAGVYVMKKRYMHLISEEDWNPTWFANQGIATFLSGYKGFGAVNPKEVPDGV